MTFEESAGWRMPGMRKKQKNQEQELAYAI
jgi:hypothetical protein